MWTKLWTVKTSDFLRGLVVAVATAPLTIIYQSVMLGSLTFDWKAIITTGLAGGIAYLLKNMVTGVGGNILTNK